MPKRVLTNVRLFVAGADLTSHSNTVEVASEAEAQDATNYGSLGWSENLQGLISTTISGAGQWEAGDPGMVDDALWQQMVDGSVGAWTVCPEGAADGALAYFTRAVESSYSLGGQVGDVAPWEAEASGSWPLVRGRVAHPPGTARTANGTGTAVQLGAAGTGQHLYASLHVLSVAGTSPSLTVEIESDDASGMLSPVSRLSFTAATARGGQVTRVLGPITDTWYRAKWTITGTTPSFLFVVAFQVR